MRNQFREISQMTTRRAIGQRKHVSEGPTPSWRRSGARVSVDTGGRQKPPHAGQRSPSPVDHAVHVLSHLRGRRQPGHAMFLGDGEALPELRRLVPQLELEERVRAGDAPVFAKNHDPADFARLIDEPLDDPTWRRKLGAAGRAQGERELAWEHSERALLAANGSAIAK